MRRGINLGNALDARPGDRRAFAADVGHLDVIRDAGFDTVRLPVAWSMHASPTAPFDIDPALFTAVDRLVDGAVERGVEVILDVHHYDELCADAAAHHDRFLALWTQIGEHFANRPSSLRFELLNEPSQQLTGEHWNDLLAETLALVRDSNPDREIVVGPAAMGTVAGLADLALPDDDRLIVTIHHYAPLPFTHQGADWLPEGGEWRGTTWGSPSEHDAVRRDLATAAAWARDRRLPLFIGEFGTIDYAPIEQRVAWTAHVRNTAEQLGIGWCYWDFATDFGVYDPVARRWNEPLRRALLNT